MKLLSKVLSALPISFLVYSVPACAIQFLNLGPNYAWVGTLSMGPSWNENNSTQTFFLAPGIEKSYRANSPHNSFFDGELFLGLQRTFCAPFKTQMGLAFSGAGSAKLSGHIWDDADPEFNNFTYRYKVSHSLVGIQGKLLLDQGYPLIPWIGVILGVGFNHAYGFINTPTIFQALPSPNFSSRTTTVFTYAFNLGVQKPITRHWQVGASYQFADWGKSQLGRASGQTLGSGLSINHLYNDSLLFNVTYLS